MVYEHPFQATLIRNFSDQGEQICPVPTCGNDLLQPEYSYSDLYLQLQYYERLFNKEKWKNKITLDKGKEHTCTRIFVIKLI